MSISTMTNGALARGVLAPRVPAQAGTGSIVLSGTANIPSGNVANALSAIAAYIPTEILTLYVAARTALVKTAGDAAIKAGDNFPEWVAFWVAFVLTRPFGATGGDFLTKPVAKGGLALGTLGSSIVLLVILFGLMAWAHRQERNATARPRTRPTPRAIRGA